MSLEYRHSKPRPAPAYGRRLALCLYAATVPIMALGLAAGANAQTVNCAAPLGPVAQTICGDPELVELDLDIGDAFRELIRTTPRAERRSVLRSQRDWLIERNGCLGEVNVRACLRAEFEYRLTDISQGLASSVAEDRPFGRAGQATEPAAEPQGPREIIDSVQLPEPPQSPPGNEDPAQPPASPVPPRIGEATLPDAPPEPAARSPEIAPGDTQADQPGNDRQPPPAPTPTPEVVEDQTPPPANPAPLDDADAQEIAKFLSSRVWRAEIASGVRPGTIYMFHANGLLLTADCVEAYRIGTWSIEGSGLRLKDGAGRNMAAEIVDRGNGYVRLKLTEARGNKVLDLVFRAARGPFACTRSR